MKYILSEAHGISGWNFDGDDNVIEMGDNSGIYGMEQVMKLYKCRKSSEENKEWNDF